ncbi:MAG: hypothetical protein K2Q34_02500 [Alphaproteobacteria bacterium]|nr:hypothetical protein [Alphaproteobacteria bacterium]
MTYSVWITKNYNAKTKKLFEWFYDLVDTVQMLHDPKTPPTRVRILNITTGETINGLSAAAPIRVPGTPKHSTTPDNKDDFVQALGKLSENSPRDFDAVFNRASMERERPPTTCGECEVAAKLSKSGWSPGHCIMAASSYVSGMPALEPLCRHCRLWVPGLKLCWVDAYSSPKGENSRPTKLLLRADNTETLIQTLACLEIMIEAQPRDDSEGGNYNKGINLF